MATLILSFILLSAIVGAMAIGVIVKGRPIKGSCGGIASLKMGRACDICGGEQNKCDEAKQSAGDTTQSAQYFEVK